MAEQFNPQTDFYSPEWKNLMKVLEEHGIKEKFDDVQKNISEPLSLDISIGLAVAFLIDEGMTETEAKQILLDAGVK